MHNTSSSEERSKDHAFFKAQAVLFIMIAVFINTPLSDKVYCHIISAKGTKMIQSGRFDEAFELFSKLDDHDEMCDYINYLRFKNTDLAKERYYMDEIPDYYDGIMAEEIAAEREYLNKRYSHHLRKIRSEVPSEPDKYKNTIPFEGMSCMYISRTYMGPPQEVEKTTVRTRDECHDRYTYTWYTRNSSRYLLFEATCIDSMSEFTVSHIKKYNQDHFWKNALPDMYGTAEKTKSSSSHRYYTPDTAYDPYDVYDYSDFGDFYYDNEADFDGLDDAESYYEEAWEDYE